MQTFDRKLLRIKYALIPMINYVLTILLFLPSSTSTRTTFWKTTSCSIMKLEVENVHWQFTRTTVICTTCYMFSKIIIGFGIDPDSLCSPKSPSSRARRTSKRSRGTVQLYQDEFWGAHNHSGRGTSFSSIHIMKNRKLLNYMSLKSVPFVSFLNVLYGLTSYTRSFADCYTVPF